ncbi:MAG: M23 family peptidase [Candidatus Solibacter sp.]|nr:M23 family peptidase [Candidatus Solibacter sp.]
MKSTLLAGALLVLIGVPAVLFYLSAPAVIDVSPAPSVIGQSTRFGVNVASPHGIRVLQVSLDQGAAHTEAGLQREAVRLTFWRTKQPPAVYPVKIGADPKLGFNGGPAKLTVQAVANNLRGQTATRIYDVTINLDPPSVAAGDELLYINQGGAALVRFRVSGYWTEAGVKVGKYRFRSFQVPGSASPGDRFCLFAWPWDSPSTEQAVVYASNPAGVEARAAFRHNVSPRNWRKRQIPIDGRFISSAVDSLDPGGSGAPIERFLRINRQMRDENNRTLAGLRLRTTEQFFWTPPFKQMSNTQVEALFADIRGYVYEGKKIDQQTHLGFDLSRVARAPVEAANSGKVVFAGPLGIYGNCVVIDHGYGLQSIYAHLSEITVKPGQTVQLNQILGRSGATGLAAGDHLHFSMQIDGVQVNPIEWWDAKWIQNRILSQLPANAVPPAASSKP